MPKQAKPEPIKPKTPSSIQKISPIAVKQQILQYKNDDSLYPLVKEYIKEAFYYCFTFGNSKKSHREALQKISQEIAIKTAR